MDSELIQRVLKTMPQPTYSESVQYIETQFDNTLPMWEAFCQEQGIDPNEPTHL